MFKSILQSRWFAVAAMVMLGFLAISFMRIQPAIVEVRKEHENLENKITEIKESNFERERLGEYLLTTAYLEHQARLKLNYKKPDEKVVYVYSKDANVVEVKNATRQAPAIFGSKFVADLKLWWGYLIE